MNKVTKRAATALRECKEYRNGNTRVKRVEYDGEVTYDFLLHGHLIARYFPTDRELAIMDAGWRTRTTKERLNGILDVFGVNARISQVNFEWKLNDKDWNGNDSFLVNSGRD
jgi:hypothetical protein